MDQLLCSSRVVSFSSPNIQRRNFQCTAALRNRTSTDYDKPCNFMNHHAKFQVPLSQNSSPIMSNGRCLPPLSVVKGSETPLLGTARPKWTEFIPKPLMPYFMLARLDHDIGWWLQVWPAYWSILLAARPGTIPDIKSMLLMGVISIIIHTSGCTINDLHDIEFDKKVERCKVRPLAAGDVTPLQGWLFWGAQLLLLVPLFLQLNKLSLGFAVAQQILIFLYPLMKRITNLPQAFLGITMSWSALVGWTAVTANLANANIFLPIYIGSVLWILGIDTTYAHQDKNDDEKAGVKSTAVMFGNSSMYWNLAFSVLSIGSFVLGGYNAHLGWPFYPVMLAAAGQLLWQVLTVDLSNPFDCNNKFISNKLFGAIVFAAILLGRLVC